MLSLPISFPTALLHLGRQSGDYGIIYLETLGLSENIKMIYEHLEKDDLVGRKLHILAENQQFESGLSGNIFTCNQSRARKYITSTWLTHISEKLVSFGISMTFTMVSPTYPTIMDVGMTKNLNNFQLRCLNNTRLHLQRVHFEDSEQYRNVQWP